MVFDLAKLAPKDTTIDASRRAGRTAEPNPWIDNNWLADAYNACKEVTVPIYAVADIVNKIRQASNQLNYSVTIQVFIDGARWDTPHAITMLRKVRDFRDGNLCTNDEITDDLLEHIAELSKSKSKATVKYVSKDRKTRVRRNTSVAYDNTTESVAA